MSKTQHNGVKLINVYCIALLDARSHPSAYIIELVDQVLYKHADKQCNVKTSLQINRRVVGTTKSCLKPFKAYCCHMGTVQL